MEGSTKLTDLKLVNKYCPPVSNYSYPRPEGGSCQERPVGRSSVGSDCSAPGMTDDQESDISAEDATQYHSAGDELWNKFWDDSESLSDAQLEEEDQHRAAEDSRSAQYPALIPSPVARRKAASLLPSDERRVVSPRARNQGTVEQNGAVTCWPLIAVSRPVTPESKPAKASYSLFPQPKPTTIVNITPRRPSRPPRSEFVWETMLHRPSTTLPHSSAGRPTKPRKLHLPTSDGAISYNSAPFVTHSAPVSPTVRDPSPSAATISRRSEPSAFAPPRQINLPRICSDTTVLYSMTTNTASQETLTPPAIPPRSPQRKQGRHSRQNSQLRNSMTSSELSAPDKPRTHTHTPRSSQVLSVSEITTQWPCTPPPPPPPPQHQQKVEERPVPVSVFEPDSDSDDEEDVNLARRIVRNLTPHKRTRSAVAAPKTRKGGELAKEQLRRARAGTLSPTTTNAAAAAAAASRATAATSMAEEKEKDAVLIGLRRQRNEVFGRLFGGRW